MPIPRPLGVRKEAGNTKTRKREEPEMLMWQRRRGERVTGLSEKKTRKAEALRVCALCAFSPELNCRCDRRGDRW